jgi:hypothetical protein
MSGGFAEPTGDPAADFGKLRRLAGPARQIRTAFLFWWHRTRHRGSPVVPAWNVKVAALARRELRSLSERLARLADAAPAMDTSVNAVALLVAAFAAIERSRAATPSSAAVLSMADSWNVIARDVRFLAWLFERAAAMFPSRCGPPVRRALNDFVCDLRGNVRVPGPSGQARALGSRRIALLCIAADVDPQEKRTDGRYDVPRMVDRVEKILKRHLRRFQLVSEATRKHVDKLRS